VALSAEQRRQLAARLDAVRIQLHALEVPSELDVDRWKEMYQEKRRLERALVDDTWPEATDGL